ncbi:MAG: hypothetical protein F6K42_01015 [Leptolyngbya sp. SIO1D8]|nr:hypothetical protein [Leptolyngbya sp. SIO1D8]
MMTDKSTIDNIFAKRQITRRDQQELMLAFSQGMLTSSDKALINRIYEALNKGFIKVVD